MMAEKHFVTVSSPNMEESFEYFFAPVDSLLTLSIKAIAMGSDVEINKPLLTTLPAHLKKKILRVMCKRSNLTLEALDALLTFDDDDLDLSEFIITNEHLKILSSRCKRLRVLNMNRGRYQTHMFTSEELIQMFPRLPLLTTFYAEGSYGITDNVIESMVDCCPRLSALDVGSCPLSDKAATSLAKLKYLRAINISATKISDDGVFVLTNGVCSNSLYEIKLNNCHTITDKAIHSIVDNCPNIKILVFHGCPLITGNCEQILTCLLTRCNVSHITYTVY